jgi:hypothetical protein
MEMRMEQSYKNKDMGRPKKQQEQGISKPDVTKEEEIRKVLLPFAEWAWGDPLTAQITVEKYFKQVINKE